MRVRGVAPPFPRRPPSFQRRLESSVRDSGAHTGRRGASAVPPAGPVIPAQAGIQRARQRSAHGAEGRPPPSPAQAPSFQRRLESSVRDSGAHTGRRSAPAVPRAGPRHSSEGWNPACETAERTRGGGAPPSFPRRQEPPSGSAHQPQSATTAPLPHRGANPYIGCMRHSHESHRLSRASGQVPSPSGRGLG